MYKDLFNELREAALVKNNLDTRKMNHEPVPIPQKPYPKGSKLIMLPEPDFLEDREISFLELMELRSTVREYCDRPLTMKELSFLLWCTQGVKMVLPAGTTKRTVPSAGGRNALETYLYIDKVEELPPGLYRFLAFEHALLPVDTEDGVKARLRPGFNKMNMYDASAVTFMWTAVLDRMDYAFGARSLQYIFLDAGHVCQNLYLASYTQNIGCCAVGHFNDVELNKELGLDGKEEFVVYAAHVGKIK
ncbi:MAG: SagB/ThcOx family dehydrogenase [Anaerovibrio sp.]|uniref:SagB/ThcOx family dehydrogenase n=1 Tax=Anaerovibrio sp. TaxID=1872532 RepID=UPI0025E454C2|nr:SagB/ThcOx family dehydrogenase [Anaerovibrio sp.]MCR5175755.1 SagB/ThcOx family dehydrogenase [Anaerovibrio sp.]